MYSKRNLVETLRFSSLFDSTYYMSQFPIDWSVIDPVEYFIDIGSKYLISPSTEFDLNKYVSMYPDSLTDFPNPLFKYLIKGHREGKQHFSVYQRAEFERLTNNCRNFYIKSFQPKLKYPVITIFAFHYFDRDISHTLIHYLEELHEILDAIFFIADKYLPYPEINNISHLLFGWNCQFHEKGFKESWRRGIEMVDQCNLFQNVSTLILCDNALLGPINSLKSFFASINEEETKISFLSLVSGESKIRDHAHSNIIKKPLLKNTGY